MTLPTRCPFRPTLETLEARTTPASLPPGFTETLAASGLTNATAMEFSPDGKLFVAEQNGTMEIWQNGTRLRTNFFANTPLTVNSAGERGLLGIAFDPNYATNHFVYVYYTATSPAVHNRVSRFTADAAGELALAGSETVLLDLNNLSSATNHNAGAIHFGPDGKLYIAVGDNANGTNAQTLNNLLGKILRINATPGNILPSDNPFFNTATGNNRAIWALGLRNPFTFAFQNGTGRMFINDVGQNTWEEINDGAAGANYNWPGTEGAFTPPNPNPNHLTPPLYTYDHGGADPNGCAITGGDFYNPTTSQFPSDYVGDYFFADFCGGWINRLDIATHTVTPFATGLSAPVDLHTTADGSLYYLDRGPGQVFQIQFTGSQAPQITQQPQDRTVTVGQSATFAVVATGTAPLTYQWQRFVNGNWSNVDGATASSFTLNNAQPSDSGAQFRVLVTNSFGSATSNTATLTVTQNQAPTATIIAPTAGTMYIAGQTIRFAGTASDPEDGTLPASAFTWRVDFHHDDHVHPFLADRTGSRSGSFVIPRRGETSANVFYRIILTVQDSSGQTFTTSQDIHPVTSQFTLANNASGVPILLDGQPVGVPDTVAGVAGMIRTLEAPASQTINGITYRFLSWSNGGPRVQQISTATQNVTYAARYYALPSNWTYKINFQPVGSFVPPGYLFDVGAPFGQRANGQTYGWSSDLRSQARDRNSMLSPGQRYDTFIAMQDSSAPNATWEIAVPNGFYQVHLVAGDPSLVNSTFKINVEDTLALDGVQTNALRWMDTIVVVHVTDGRLTISNADGAVNNKINYVEIRPVAPPSLSSFQASRNAQDAVFAAELFKLGRGKQR
jgi:glucose/arabinose dehydrogenase